MTTVPIRLRYRPLVTQGTIFIRIGKIQYRRQGEKLLFGLDFPLALRRRFHVQGLGMLGGSVPPLNIHFATDPRSGLEGGFCSGELDKRLRAPVDARRQP